MKRQCEINLSIVKLHEQCVLFSPTEFHNLKKKKKYSSAFVQFFFFIRWYTKYFYCFRKFAGYPGRDAKQKAAVNNKFLSGQSGCGGLFRCDFLRLPKPLHLHRGKVRKTLYRT